MKTAQSNQKSGTAELVAKAADEFLKAAEASSPPPVEEFVERYPQIAAILRDVLPALAIINPSLSGNKEKPLGTDDLIDRRLGDFRLIREIGRGGMGVVYEAEQISLGRSVALKVLPFAGVLDEKQLQRFKNEARAAAALEHPHIVPVYSVGCERGVHYYAMRLVDGQSLAEVLRAMPEYRASESEVGEWKSEVEGMVEGRCKGKESPNDSTSAFHSPLAAQPTSLDGDTRPKALASTLNSNSSKAYFHNIARLGIQAAEALAYAHEQGILHRDIKPGNLLLDTNGDLWIADFGLARLEHDAGVTVTGDLLGTLRYMSPEQASGRRVLDEQSDVYSLGVTLYELLVLRPAFSGRDRQEVLRHITTDEPTPPRKLNPRIPLDLETIILRAIAKEPTCRYQSAKDLADDLRRFNSDQPIHARRPKLAEKLVKWSRRHPATVLSAVVISTVVAIVSITAAALINGAKDDAVTAQELESKARVRADEQSQLALKTLKLVVNEIQSKLKGVKGAAEVRRTLLNTAIDGLRQLARNQSTANNASDSLVHSHLDLGDAFYLTGEIKSAHSLEEALAQFQAAHDIALKLVGRLPSDIRAQRDLSVACERIGNVNMALGRVTAARDFYQKELEVSQKLVHENPQNSEVRRDLAVAYQFMATADLRLGNIAAARSDCQKLLEISRKLAEESPANVSAQVELAAAHERLGDVNLKLGKLSAARGDFQKELELRRKAAQDDAANVGLQDALTIAYRRLASVDVQLGNLAAARDACQKAVAISQKLVGADQESGFQRGLSLGCELLGDVDLQLGDIVAAGEDYRRFAELSEKLARGDPKDAESQRYLSVAYERLGTVNSRSGSAEAARDAYQKFVEISEKLAQLDPHDSAAQRALALSYERLGNVNLQTGKLSAARDAYQRFSGIIERLAGQDPNNSEAQRDLTVALSKMGGVAQRMGDLTAARDFYRRELTIAQKLMQANPRSAMARLDLARSYISVATIDLKFGKVRESLDNFQKSRELAEQLVREQPDNSDAQGRLVTACSNLAMLTPLLGDMRAAREVMQRLVEVAAKRAAAQPRDMQAQADLATVYGQLGALNRTLGDIPAADQACQRRLDICVKLVQQDNKNDRFQRNLAVAHEGLGKMSLLKGDFPAARDHFQKLFDYAEQRTRAQPDDLEAQRDLSCCYGHFGDTSRRERNVSAARDDFQKSLDIRSRLSNLNASNRDAKCDLADTYRSLGEAEEAAENFPAAVSWFEKGVAILVSLDKDGAIGDRPDRQAAFEAQKHVIELCKQAPQAVESLEFALSAPRDLIPELLGLRSRALANSGKPEDAAIAADKLASLDLGSGHDLFHGAIGFALCAEGVRIAGANASPSPHDEPVAEHYAARAIELLTKAQQLGYFEAAINRAALQDEANLNSLRARDDFNKILQKAYEK